MIELIFEDRCTGCGDCVATCPTDVFDLFPAGAPVIARQDQCQICFLCGFDCAADALYVGPMRRDQAWDPAARDTDPLDQYRRLGPLLGPRRYGR